ncbi:hypothetical protein H8959_016964 [Pygathrix nigripes]
MTNQLCGNTPYQEAECPECGSRRSECVSPWQTVLAAESVPGNTGLGSSRLFPTLSPLVFWVSEEHAVADVLQFSMETGGYLPNCITTLQDSLIKHLKVAPKYLSFLEKRQKLIQEYVCKACVCSKAINSVKVEDEMMSDLTTLVDGYLNTYREGSADRLGGTEVDYLWEITQETALRRCTC